MKWLKYSGLWIGFVLNPFHWRFEWIRDRTKEFPSDCYVFENAIYFGPFWIRLIIDDGRW